LLALHAISSQKINVTHHQKLFILLECCEYVSARLSSITLIYFTYPGVVSYLLLGFLILNRILASEDVFTLRLSLFARASYARTCLQGAGDSFSYAVKELEKKENNFVNDRHMVSSPLPLPSCPRR
jgi:hypothetical protein